MGQVKEGLGGRIQQARLSAGLTQEELARAAGVSVRNVVRWENNWHRPRLDHLISIADATGVDTRELMGADDDDESSAPVSREASVFGRDMAEMFDRAVDRAVERHFAKAGRP